jgi:FkbH-like protein
MQEALRKVAEAADFSQAHRALLDCDLARLSSGNYAACDRALRRVISGSTVKIAYLSNFTVDLLPAYVNVRCAREGLPAAAYVGPFNQYFQEILADGAPLRAFTPDIVLLSLSLRQLRPQAVAAFGSLSVEARVALRDDVLAHIEEWTAHALRKLDATILITNFVTPARPAAGTADLKAEYGETEFLLDLNLALLRRFKAETRVHVLDLDRLAGLFGKDRVTDLRMYHLAKMEWSEDFLPVLADEILRHVKAIRGLTKKCLVLDLDNTLWGGVVGEDGPGGVRIGPGDPEGEAYLAFQHRIRAIKERGILLALCSKNNPADVEEVFRLRPEMPLRPEDFAVTAIGWEPKHVGLAAIAKELNIGTDSLVFVDDNPAEVALVNEFLPEVETVQLPPDPARFVETLDRLTAFEKPWILREDTEKGEQYRQMRARRALERQAGNLNDYLAGLQTKLRIRPATPADLPRLHQLFSKTNQFNVTTRRYSPGELEAFLATPSCELDVVWAADRFGELGTIAAYLLRRADGRLEIDSFLMSCRAMGRGIETAIMNRIKATLLEAPDCTELTAQFVPTSKNMPAATFFDDQGFRRTGERDAGRTYVLRREDATPMPCAWVEMVE